MIYMHAFRKQFSSSFKISDIEIIFVRMSNTVIAV